MKVLHIYSINQLENSNHTLPSVVTIGNFDGVHLGHQFLISQVVKKAKEIKGQSIVITFSPHPASVFLKQPFCLLQEPSQKIESIAALGVDILVIIDFSLHFAALSYQDFITNYITKPFKIHTLILGHDFRCGKGKEGNFSNIQPLVQTFLGETVESSAFHLENEIVSSSKIRNYLEQGNIEKANQLLGYQFQLQGSVIEGKKIGRTLGFPTANLQLNQSTCLSNGIYIASAKHQNKTYPAAVSIGYNPTVNGTTLSIEAYLLDFSANIYGEQLTLQFHKRIRDEIKFSSLEKLIEQIQNDTKSVRFYFAHTRTKGV